MEMFLNTEAAVDGLNVVFQIFNFGVPNSDDSPPYYWPPFLVPDIVKKFDIDEVILCFNAEMNNSNLSPFFQRPLGPDEIPLWRKSPEFMLKPTSGHLGGRVEAFIQRNTQAGGGHIFFRSLINNPRERPELAYAFSRPLLKLKNELETMRTTAGEKIGVHLFYFPSGPIGAYSLVEPNRTLWSEVAKDAQISFTDLTDGFLALRQDYFPAAENFDSLHPTANGYSLRSVLLANELIKQGWIRWK
jgi:hypothetical protein